MTAPLVFRAPFKSDRLNLICLPQAGADSAGFMRLTPLTTPLCSVVPVALPGRAMRLEEPVPARLEDMADEIFEALAKQVIRPYALVGSSMGGWLGYEICKRIELAGLPAPMALVLVVSPTPDTPRALPDLAHKSSAECAALLRQFNPTLAPALEHDELLELVLPTIRADFAACLSYHPARIPIKTDILAFSGLKDHVVTAETMKGWRNWTEGDFRLTQLPGDHSLLDTPPAGLTLALRSLAARALA